MFAGHNGPQEEMSYPWNVNTKFILISSKTTMKFCACLVGANGTSVTEIHRFINILSGRKTKKG